MKAWTLVLLGKLRSEYIKKCDQKMAYNNPSPAKEKYVSLEIQDDIKTLQISYRSRQSL